MLLSRGPQVAYYTTPTKVTAERVTARFGRLGELDYASLRSGITATLRPPAPFTG